MRDASDLFRTQNGEPAVLSIDDIDWPPQPASEVLNVSYGTVVGFYALDDQGHEIEGVLATDQAPDIVAGIVYHTQKMGKRLAINGQPSDVFHPTSGLMFVVGHIVPYEATLSG